MAGSPWTFQAHPGAWVVVLALGAAYVLATRRLRRHDPPVAGPTPRQRTSFAGGLVLLWVAIAWPLADLAVHWSLTALVVQRLVLLLAVPPLLVLGTPQALMSALTRPAPVDWLIWRLCRAVPAVITVTVVAVATLSVGAVQWQASSPVGRWVLDAVLLAAGVVLWAPVLQRIPGLPRLSPLGKAGYLIAQSIVPSFLAIVWIFAKHPLYPAYAHKGLFGLEAVTDQQIAGFVAKFGTILALWTVAFVMVNRAQGGLDGQDVEEPLRWADVERELQRAERLERHPGRHRPLPGTVPGGSEGPGGLTGRPTPGTARHRSAWRPWYTEPGPSEGQEGGTPGAGPVP